MSFHIVRFCAISPQPISYKMLYTNFQVGKKPNPDPTSG
ncbi:hypothetical protein D1BOALGB6SA_6576 [Olavius sp. associated proteobacterium Delta 1]|nr:hypothetical protein D1BOALGB6SA_6576 [Olavius sp. associated proteobacterium Delta 1]